MTITISLLLILLIILLRLLLLLTVYCYTTCTICLLILLLLICYTLRVSPQLYHFRKKFCRAFNSIYEKVGNKNSVTLLTFLLSTQCVPILLYGTDAAGVDRHELRRLYIYICTTFNRAFIKNNNSYDAKINMPMVLVQFRF